MRMCQAAMTNYSASSILLTSILMIIPEPRLFTSPLESIIELPSHQETCWLVEEFLFRQRSIRNYADATLSLEQLGQPRWVAQGITDRSGLRTATSAGALYPLLTHIPAQKVDGLSQ